MSEPDEEDLRVLHRRARADAEGVLEMFTVYENPRDFPGHFVVRRWRVGPGGSLAVEREAWAVERSYEAVRATIPEGLFCMPRQPDDEPQIVEVWF